MHPILLRTQLVLLAFILILAITAALHGIDSSAAPLIAACCLLWGWTAYHRHSTWAGLNFFLLSWLLFPLFKIIDRNVVPWHADALLASLDRALWGGQILPAYFHYETQPLLTDLLACCYFSFFLIVLGSVACYTRQRTTTSAARYFNGLTFLYGTGFLGYLCLPAAGPAFTTLPDGGASGFIAPQLIAIVKDGVTGMDVFPSLHTAVSFFITVFLWCDGKRMAALVCAPLTAGTIAATIFLRYHYGVDVLAGFLLAVLALWLTRVRQVTP